MVLYEMAAITPELSGTRFSELLVIYKDHKEKQQWYWMCICSCGKFKLASTSNLRRGRNKSCGHLTSLPTRFTHLMSKGRAPMGEYDIWRGMKKRVLLPSSKDYARYGGRGITMCAEWINDFMKFYNHVGPRPGRGYSIERIDNNGNYEPGNVKWATMTEQAKNKRHAPPSIHVWFDGCLRSLPEVSQITGIKYLKLWLNTEPI